MLLSWVVAQSLADPPYDRALGEVVHRIAAEVIAARAAGRQPAVPGAGAALLPAAGLSEKAELRHHQVRDSRGELIAGIDSLPQPAQPPESGLHFRDDRLDGSEVRVAFLWVDMPDPQASGSPWLVQVAESRGLRSQLAGEIIKGVILPQLVILPLAVLLLWLALARGMAPVAALQRRIRQRHSADLRPIDVRDVPEELSPLLHSINDLLMRLDQSVRLQRRFLTDAAHQLKTPLAGLRTQAELAQRSLERDASDARAPQQVRRSLRQIVRGSQGAAHTVDQLLSMARTEDPQHLARDQQIDLTVLAAEAVRDFVPMAMEKRIDLGFEGPGVGLSAAASHALRWRTARGNLRIRGNALLLRELIRNLVDNALQYTPAGGTATVRVIADPFGQVMVLQVEDSGPGIAPAERRLVFQPFYRALGTQVDGSGLGLAIVREIATLHDVEVLLEDANVRHRPGLSEQACGAFGPGARFTLRFRVCEENTDDKLQPPTPEDLR